MPGKLVNTNEVTVLLGDNWFSKCSAKQAVELVEHRKKCMYIFEHNLIVSILSFHLYIIFVAFTLLTFLCALPNDSCSYVVSVCCLIFASLRGILSNMGSF